MKRIIIELNTLWRLAVIARAFFVCEKCGKRFLSWELEAHHIFPLSRRINSLHWLLDNGSCLCSRGCHRWATDNPKQAREWYRAKRGEKWYLRVSKIAMEVWVMTDGKYQEIKIGLMNELEKIR